MAYIYALTAPSKSAYIGSTKNTRKRFREHRCLLRQGKHQSPLLQAEWLKHGEDGWEVVVLEECGDHKDEKRSREQHWIDQYAEQGRLLNNNDIAGAPPRGAQAKAAAKRVANGYRPSAESNLKRRIAQLGVPKGHGAKISATKKKKIYSGHK
jgi:group I intron endonuclease